VYDVMQDSKGFIWFATDLGLIRYDGSEYKVYYSPQQTSLGGSSLREDKMGRIWYENFDGYLYYVEKDTLQALIQNKPVAYLPIGITENHLFLLQKDGIDVYDIATLNIVQKIQVHTTILENTSTSHEAFFMIADDIVYKIDKNFQIKTSHKLNQTQENLKQIFYYQNKVYVLGRYNTLRKIWVFDTNLNFIGTLPIPEITTSINYANFVENNLWIHTPKGTFLYALQPTFQFQKVYFEDKSVSAVLKDRQNNHWFTTTNQGVFLVADLNNLFFPLENYLPYRIIHIDNDYLLATKKGELILYDKNFVQKKLIKPSSDNTEIYFLHYDSLSQSIFYSSKGFTFLPEKNYAKKQFYEIALKDITKIDDKYFAFAASGYCGLINFQTNKISTIWDKKSIYSKNPPHYFVEIIRKSRGKAVAYDEDKNVIYFATNIGLFRTDTQKTTELKFNNSSFYASRLFFANKKLYALSTKGNFYFIDDEKKLYLLNFLFGAKANEIRQIKKIKDKLYVLSNKGLFNFDVVTQKMQIIDANINTSEINDFTANENFLVLINDKGFIRISLAESKKNKVIPRLQIRSFVAGNLSHNFEEKILLKHDENDIHIAFSVLDFNAPHLNKTYYRLNRSEWKELNERNLRLEALKAGNYLLEFKINEQTSPKNINFIILVPFWKTLWFWIGSSLLVLLLGFAYYRWQIKKLREQNKLLQEKIILEQQFNKSVLTSIKSQMNPHFFYNALNTIQAYIFTNDKIKANSYLAKFSKLTRLILEHSEKENISLAEEIEALTLYLELEKMRFKEDFSYEIHTEKVFHRDSIELPPMIIQPYVENAIKHGLLHKENDKKLDLIFEEREKELLVIIEDNGIGRKRSTELNQIKRGKHISFATQANEKRLEILNKASNKKVGVSIVDKYDKDLPTGTKVILNIPLNDKN
jgi:two-component sensor histidine kinase